MTGDARISRPELAAVAVALLLPIPLLVAGGLRLGLPGAIERGTASLLPGGGFDAAVVEAAPARTDPAPAAVPSGTGPVGGVSADAAPSVSSAAGSTPSSGASSAPNEKRDETTPVATDSPRPPGPHTDDQAPSGGGDGSPGGETGSDTPETPPGESVEGESIVAIGAEAAGASVQVTVSDSGVAVDTGGAADIGPPVEVPLELPLAPPALPLP